MHFKCSKNELLSALQVIFPAISNKTSLPILNNVLLKITENNILNLVSTDLEIAIKTQLNIEVLKSGEITLPAKKLLDITREIGGNEIELKSNEDLKVYITSGKSKFTIMGLDSSDFPAIPEIGEKDSIFSINKEVLKDLIRKTIFAVSYDETRYILNGLLFKLEDNKLIVVSTDGRRLCYIKHILEQNAAQNKELVIPTKTVNELLKLLSVVNTENIEFIVGENQISFKLDKHILISKIIDGTFPNYNQVIPKNFSLSINLNKDELFSITKRVALLTSDKSQSIKYSFWNNKLLVSASSQGVGEAEDEIEISYDKSAFDIAYNPNFILDILRNIDGKEIVLELSTPVNPGVIRPIDKINYICVIMPMRV